MADIDLTIAGRTYSVAAREGDEPHLRHLESILQEHARPGHDVRAEAGCRCARATAGRLEQGRPKHRHPRESGGPSPELAARAQVTMGGYVYIVANRKNGALYTGVTADIAQRVWQHRNRTGSRFTTEHEIFHLVYVEFHEEIEDAIVREKRIKKWRRAWKVALIEESNPDWRDLWFDLNR